jgi:hypothetical protein
VIALAISLPRSTAAAAIPDPTIGRISAYSAAAAPDSSFQKLRNFDIDLLGCAIAPRLPLRGHCKAECSTKSHPTRSFALEQQDVNAKNLLTLKVDHVQYFDRYWPIHLTQMD